MTSTNRLILIIVIVIAVVGTAAYFIITNYGGTLSTAVISPPTGSANLSLNPNSTDYTPIDVGEDALFKVEAGNIASTDKMLAANICLHYDIEYWEFKSFTASGSNMLTAPAIECRDDQGQLLGDGYIELGFGSTAGAIDVGSDVELLTATFEALKETPSGTYANIDITQYSGVYDDADKNILGQVGSDGNYYTGPYTIGETVTPPAASDPDPITSFKATAGTDNIELTWTNPDLTATKNQNIKLKILRSEDDYPTVVNDSAAGVGTAADNGEIVYNKTLTASTTKYTDSNVTKDKPYYYTAYTENTNGDTSTGSTDSAKITSSTTTDDTDDETDATTDDTTDSTNNNTSNVGGGTTVGTSTGTTRTGTVTRTTGTTGSTTTAAATPSTTEVTGKAATGPKETMAVIIAILLTISAVYGVYTIRRKETAKAKR